MANLKREQLPQSDPNATMSQTERNMAAFRQGIADAEEKLNKVNEQLNQLATKIQNQPKGQPSFRQRTDQIRLNLKKTKLEDSLRLKKGTLEDLTEMSNAQKSVAAANKTIQQKKITQPKQESGWTKFKNLLKKKPRVKAAAQAAAVTEAAPSINGPSKQVSSPIVTSSQPELQKKSIFQPLIDFFKNLGKKPDAPTPTPANKKANASEENASKSGVFQTIGSVFLFAFKLGLFVLFPNSMTFPTPPIQQNKPKKEAGDKSSSYNDVSGQLNATPKANATNARQNDNDLATQRAQVNNASPAPAPKPAADPPLTEVQRNAIANQGITNAPSPSFAPAADLAPKPTANPPLTDVQRNAQGITSAPSPSFVPAADLAPTPPAAPAPSPKPTGLAGMSMENLEVELAKLEKDRVKAEKKADKELEDTTRPSPAPKPKMKGPLMTDQPYLSQEDHDWVKQAQKQLAELKGENSAPKASQPNDRPSPAPGGSSR